MTIILTEFRQESNSLSPFTSGMDFWTSGWILSPDEAEQFLPRQNCAVTGMKEVLDATSYQIVFGPAYYSQSGGTAEQEVMDRYLAELLPLLESTPTIEAVFFSFHGALQTTEFDDAESEVIRRVREVVGDEVIIAASTDSHGFISRELIKQLDVLTGYHTYPHIDFMETGRRSARLGIQAIENRSNVIMAWVPVPMLVSASGYDTLKGPYKQLIEHGQRLVQDDQITDFSIYQMQPWLDVTAPTSAVVVCASTEKEARKHAEDLAQRLYDHRHEFEPELIKVGEIIDRITAGETTSPTVIVDSADSPNAGSSADSMYVPLLALHAEIPPGSAFSLLSVVVDRPAVEKFFNTGVGNTITLTLGATVNPKVPKLDAECYVKSLHDGWFRNEHVGSSGIMSYLGRTAVVSIVSERLRIDLVVCEQLVSPGDPQLYRGMGLEPIHYQAVVVKANTSFKAAYAQFAGDVFMADTPGAAPPKIAGASYAKIPPTIYPWIDAPFHPHAEILRRGRSQESSNGDDTA